MTNDTVTTIIKAKSTLRIFFLLLHFADTEGIVIHVLNVAIDLTFPQSHLACQRRPEFRAEIRAFFFPEGGGVEIRADSFVKHNNIYMSNNKHTDNLTTTHA
jgi:hypothetical protein